MVMVIKTKITKVTIKIIKDIIVKIQIKVLKILTHTKVIIKTMADRITNKVLVTITTRDIKIKAIQAPEI